MKKKLVAVGAASLAVAAMPMVGVFAETGNTMKDTINVTVTQSCLITATSMNNTLATVELGANGSADSVSGTQMSITCNKDNGWTLTAKGAGTTDHEQDIYSSTVNKSFSGTSTTASYWQFMVEGTTTASAYNSFSSIPDKTTGVTVASAAGASTGAIVTPTYKIVSNNQSAANDYTGAISYTLAPAV